MTKLCAEVRKPPKEVLTSFYGDIPCDELSGSKWVKLKIITNDIGKSQSQNRSVFLIDRLNILLNPYKRAKLIVWTANSVYLL